MQGLTTSEMITQRLWQIRFDFIEELSPETRVIVSSLTVRTDFQGAIRKIGEVNHILSRSLRVRNMIIIYY